MTARVATLRAGEEPVDHDDLPARPLALVLQLPHGLVPRGVVDRHRQRPVLHHACDVQVLRRHDSVLVDRRSGHLVDRIRPGVGDPDRQMRQARVDPDLLGGRRKRYRLELAQAGHEVAPRRVHRHRDRRRLRGQRSRPAHVQRLRALGERQLPAPVLEARAGELRRLPAVLGLEARVAGAALEEVREGALLVAKALLGRDRRDLAKPREVRFGLQLGQPCRRFGVPDGTTTVAKGVRPPAQHVVADDAHASERPREKPTLLVGGIEPVLVGTLRCGSHRTARRCKNPRHGRPPVPRFLPSVNEGVSTRPTR